MVQARYRYRIEPTPVQGTMLARTFGCARVVFNDAVRARDKAWQAGERLSSAEVQRRVITLAKTTEARSWLTEVASVALVQSVRDAERAYRNFFRSCGRISQGRKVGRPRLKSIIREPDNRYYASFVVKVEPTPLPVVVREAGVDLGIARLGTVADTTGHRVDIANPKHLSRKQRKIARLEREKARRTEGSANRAKTRRKIAVQHGKVVRARRDYHHKQTLGLIRENQAVYVEDLHIAGMVHNRRLARAIHDAAWAQFVRLLKEKAERYGRTVHTVSRWLPSTKTCSSCGHVMVAIPLRIRDWLCPTCGTTHDRDHNAAKIILAAGRAERLNAGGAPISPSLGEAQGDEAGSTPGATWPLRNFRPSGRGARQPLVLASPRAG